MLSDTTLISKLGSFIALSISKGKIPNVLPADVPPLITLIRFFKRNNFLIAVVTINSIR